MKTFEILLLFMSISDGYLPDGPLALWGKMGLVFNQMQLTEKSRHRAIGYTGHLCPSLTSQMQSFFWVA